MRTLKMTYQIMTLKNKILFTQTIINYLFLSYWIIKDILYVKLGKFGNILEIPLWKKHCLESRETEKRERI